MQLLSAKRPGSGLWPSHCRFVSPKWDRNEKQNEAEGFITNDANVKISSHHRMLELPKKCLEGEAEDIYQ